MPLIDDDQETVRKYLLGHLTGDEQQKVEERLLSEDELTAEFEVSKEELVDQYLAKELSPTESEWFEQHFLRSPEGQRSHKFAWGLRQYVANHPPELKKTAWGERLSAFWRRQAAPLRAAAALALVVVVVGTFWFSRPSSPQTFANLTLTNTSITRSGGGNLERIKLREDALRITLILPESAPPAVRYQAQLIDGSAHIRTLEPIAQDARSVSVEISASQLPPAQYAVNLSSIKSDNTSQRIGSYQFIVE